MTDKELTERAARAAGKEVLGWIDHEIHTRDHADATPDIGMFDPLNNNGDALCLAVKMQLGTIQQPASVSITREFKVVLTEIHYGGNAEAATRRAIVRAAATLATPA